jgi:outer membrane protein assembly factor BamB
MRSTLFFVLLATLSWPALAGDFEQNRRDNWHQWRGPEANGFAPNADPPITWGPETNVKWKVEVPGQGESSPIVWGDRVLVTTAIETDRKEEKPPAEAPEAPGGNPFRIERPTNYYQFVVLCYDRKSGKPLWQQVATEQVPHEGHHKDHGFASPSPVTDGRHVYTSFGSRGIYCWDMDGKLKWSRDLGDLHMYRFFGEGSSPVLDGQTLIVNWDHEGDSFLNALDTRTGERTWQVQREPP